MNDKRDSSSDQDHPSAPAGRPLCGTDTGSSQFGSSNLSDFEIIREIGRGGTSIVYEARQTSLRRNVALKQLPLAAVFDERWLERFWNEVRTASQLNHPNIVAFFEAGQDDDSHFYTMQLVDGISLAAVIKRLRQCRDSIDDAARPCRNPPINGVHPAFLKLCQRSDCPLAGPECGAAPGSDGVSSENGDSLDLIAGHSYHKAIARIILEAARALDYAHEQEILHLDVKPSNILLDVEGKVWVTDFGASRSGSGNGSSGAGGRVGTLRYMSPEQMLGVNEPLDRRSDVYSLGATLYELLTLERRFVDETHQANIAHDSGRDSRSARDVNPSIPRELETVVQKATADEPDQRYATAGELADDLQRFLESEPAHRQQPNLLGRVAHWSSQHKLLAGMGAILLVALFAVAGSNLVSNGKQRTETGREGGLAVEPGQPNARAAESQRPKSSYTDTRQADRAKEQARRANPSPNEATRRRQIGQEHYERASAALREYLARVSAEKPPNSSNLQPPRKVLLDSALEYYQQFMAEPGNDRKLLVELAGVYYGAGNITSEIGWWEEALTVYQTALDILTELVAENPDVLWYQKDLAGSYNQIGLQQAALGKSEEALASYQRAIEISQSLVDKDPAVLVNHRYLANHYLNLGRLQNDMGKADAALHSHQTALRIRETLANEHPEIPDLRSALAASHNSVGTLQRETGKLDGALLNFQKAIETERQLADENPDVAQYRDSLARHYDGLGHAQEAMGKLDEAVVSFQTALDIRERLATEHPSAVNYQSACATSLKDLGSILTVAERLEEARPVLQRAIEIGQQLAREHPSVVDYRSALAKSYDALGRLLCYTDTERPEEAQACFQRATDILEQLVKENPAMIGYQWQLAGVYNNLGMMQQDAGNSEEALSSYYRAIEISKSFVDQNPSMPEYQEFLANHYFNLGDLQQALGKPQEAASSFQEAISIRETLVDKYSKIPSYQFVLAHEYVCLGRLLSDSGQLDKAATSYRKAIEIQQRLVATNPDVPDHQQALTGTYSDLGRALAFQGKLGEAINQFREGIELQPEDAEAHCNLGMAFQMQGNFGEAIAAYRTALSIQPDLAPVHNNLAWIFATSVDPQLRQPEEAVAHAKKSLELAPAQQDSWNTLGVAYYRNGQWMEAINALQKSTELSVTGVGTAPDWLFLAMAHWQLDQKDEAGKWRDKAAAWMKENQPDDELTRFRAEADELMGLAADGAQPAPSPAGGGGDAAR